MLTLRCIIAVVVAYLLGSLNFSIIVSKLLLKKDIRDFGSGNAGTTNSYRVMGGAKASFVIIGDALKGIAAVMLVNPIVGEYQGSIDVIRALVGAAAVFGHAFPVFFDFRGGKGVLTTAAVVLCLDYRVCLIAVIIFLLLVALTRYVSVGSIVAVWSAPVSFSVFYGINMNSLVFILLGAVLAAFVTILHRSNIKRLLSGTENKFSFKKKST